MTKILVVEDEAKIARFVELELTHEGYEVDKVDNGRSAVEQALENDYDLVLLDILLPQLNGMEVLRRIRKEKDVPVILLTARDAVMDKVAGLDAGADDYITKPFAIEELLARIRVILRNAEAAEEEREKKPAADVLEAGGIALNPESHLVTYRGKPVELTNREFILLRILLENRGTVMSREKLLSEAWGYDYYGETNIIDVYVRYIRQKTSDDVIRTIRGVGYMIE